MFTPVFIRRVSQIVLLIFTATTLQQGALAAGRITAYAYDANGNITQRTTPAGTVAYAYDRD